MNRLFVVGLVCGMAAQIVIAGPLDSAFDRMNNFANDNWSFQRVSEGAKGKVEEFNPLNEPRWTLVEINNEPPTEKQLADYRQHKVKEAKAKEGGNGKLNLQEMIDVDSLVLIEDLVDSAKYSFRPIIEDGEGFSDSLEGELWHNKQFDFIERFDFFSTDSFSPMAGVKIKRMYTSFKFKQIDENIFAPEQMNMEVSGRAFVFKTIDDKESQKYDQYQPINE